MFNMISYRGNTANRERISTAQSKKRKLTPKVYYNNNDFSRIPERRTTS